MKPFLEDNAPQQSSPTQGAAGPSGQAPFAVRGNPDDDIRRAEAMDPTEVEEVTEEEQAQYNDLVSRAIAMISDSRMPEGLEDGKSPSDAVIEIMSNSSFSVPQALSEGTVATLMILHDAAKRAEKPYSADVMFHAADEVIAALYMLGSAAGIFEGASDYAKSGGGIQPAPQPMAEEEAPVELTPGMPRKPQPPAAPAPMEQAMPMEAETDDGGDFTDEEYAMLGEAFMMTVELFGRKLMESGQLTEEDRQAAMQFWQTQIAKEAETGQLDEAMFDDMDIDAIRNQIMKRGM